MNAPIEAKVAYPAAAGAALVAFVGSVLLLLQAFNVDLTQTQVTAIVGVVTAALPVVHFVVGFLTHHTPRPDLVTLDGGQAEQ